MLDQLIQQLVNGITIGVIYALVAIGFTMIFGILEIINFAQGEFYMIGAFITYYFVTLLGLNYFVAVAISMGVVGLIGFCAEYLTIKPLREKPLMTTILSTFGLSIFIENSAMVGWGPTPKLIPSPITDVIFSFPFLRITGHRLFLISFGIIVIISVMIFIQRSKMGKAMRATAAERDAAALMGVNIGKIYGFTFAFGTSLAGLAGGLLGAIFSVYPTMGVFAIIKSFVVVIVGGMGSMKGAIYAGLGLGIIETLGAGYISTEYKDSIGFAVMILFLLFYPQGIFGYRRSR